MSSEPAGSSSDVARSNASPVASACGYSYELIDIPMGSSAAEVPQSQEDIIVKMTDSGAGGCCEG
jgi:hypothetical protein